VTTMQPDASVGASRFRPRIEFAVLAALFLAVFGPFLASLVKAWIERPDASHGWFVLPIALWIAWRERNALATAPAGTYQPAIAVIILGLLAAIVSTRAALDSIGRLALVLTLNGLLLYLLGAARYRVIAFPALFLFLMVPVPITFTGAVTFPLQIFASKLSALSIGMLGIPVMRMGNVLELPGGKLEVAEACSGLRSLMSFVTLGVLLAWVTRGTWRKIAVGLLAVPFALVANVLRITVTAAAVHLFGPAGASGFVHEVVGIGSFLAGLALYAMAARLLGSRWAAE
jgi:exosortase